MRVVIVGYGRMGREIEAVLRARGHEASARVDANGSGDAAELTAGLLAEADGAIEFALADGIAGRLALYAASGKPTVIGTTGWDYPEDEARSLVAASGGAVMKGSNYSTGAHLFFRLTAAAARMIDRAEEYDAAVVEYHHTGKADHPSGTALTAAKGILAGLNRKTRVLTELPDGPVPADALQVAAVRVGAEPGIHEMRMDSPADSLIVRHEARGRGGLALGAVKALEWLRDRKGYFDVRDFYDDILGPAGGA
jgi:4-hydroxy-tetrahydrodipicolinate reductase